MTVIYRPSGRAAEYSHLACNPYNGCPHGCTYCYVPAARRMKAVDFHAKAEPKKNFLARLGTDAKRLAGTHERVLLSFSCDPYPPIEASRCLTRTALSVLKKHDIPFQVLTKGGLLAARDFGLYRPGIDAFAVTLTTLDTVVAAEIEPGAAPPCERIDTLIEAHDRGIETWVSLEPVIKQIESLKVITMTHEYVDLYKIGTLNHVKSDITSKQWADFARRAINLCTACGARYFIKHDLARHSDLFGDLQVGNTDNRTVIR
jgi:DNA repair photolyase